MADDMVTRLNKQMMEIEKEELRKVLKDEPTMEELQYCRELKLQANRERESQRAANRENIRRFVFGESSHCEG